VILSEKVLYFCTDVGHYYPIKSWRPVCHSPAVAVHRAAGNGGEVAGEEGMSQVRGA